MILMKEDMKLNAEILKAANEKIRDLLYFIN